MLTAIIKETPIGESDGTAPVWSVSSQQQCDVDLNQDRGSYPFMHARATKSTHYSTWVPLFDDGKFYRAIWEVRTDYHDRIGGTGSDQHLSRERSTVLKRLHIQGINASEMRQAMDEGFNLSYQRAWDATFEIPTPKESYLEEEARRLNLGSEAYGMTLGEQEDEDSNCEE